MAQKLIVILGATGGQVRKSTLNSKPTGTRN